MEIIIGFFIPKGQALLILKYISTNINSKIANFGLKKGKT